MRRAASEHQGATPDLLAGAHRGGLAVAEIPVGSRDVDVLFPGPAFELLPLDETDLSGIAAILGKYRGLGRQLADAFWYIWQIGRGLKPFSH